MTQAESSNPGAPSAETAGQVTGLHAELRWEVHLAREAPVTGVLGGLLVAVFALAVDASTGSLGWGLFAAGVLLFSLRRFFFPFTMRMDDAGVAWPRGMRVRRVAWRDITRVELFPRWALLHVRAKPGPRRRRPLTLHLGRKPEVIGAELRMRLPESALLETHAATP